MVTILPLWEGHRTRLTGLLDPNFNDAALAEAIAASLYSRLAEGEKARNPSQTALLAEPSLRDCLSLAEDRLYTQCDMADVFSAYHKHLFNCDLAPKTKERYWQVVSSYQKWLNDRSPDVTTAQEFLADLRSKG